jgi:hypothetical protein
MDPVSVLHLITTVAGVAYSVISKTYTILQVAKAIKDAPKDAQNLRREMTSISSLLQSLEEVVTSPNFTASTSLKDDLLDFQSMLNDMNATMAILETQRLEQVKWPFTVKETKDKLLKVERYKATFELALTVDIA